MEQNFNDAWDSLEILNAIPQNVCNEIDILSGATEKFINEVVKLENMTDFAARGKEAQKYIEENNGLSIISFDILVKYLTNYNSCSISVWRQLYLLERSIPPRKNAEQKSWLDRLKIFADTYLLERAVNGKTLIGLPGKILFTRNSGDHENLHAGPGNYATDFYCWDKVNNKRHAWVEFKHWGSTNIENAKTYYADNKYDARYVLVFLADHTYKLIDYDTNNIIDQPDLPVPLNLSIW